MTSSPDATTEPLEKNLDHAINLLEFYRRNLVDITDPGGSLNQLASRGGGVVIDDTLYDLAALRRAVNEAVRTLRAAIGAVDRTQGHDR